MGWLRDIFTGYDYRLTFNDGVREVRYTLDAGTSMKLIGPGLDEGVACRMHRYERPLAIVTRKEGGPVSLKSNDKGRWFVTLADLASDRFPVMTFQCRNKAEAMGIKRRADALRGDGPLL